MKRNKNKNIKRLVILILIISSFIGAYKFFEYKKFQELEKIRIEEEEKLAIIEEQKRKAREEEERQKKILEELKKKTFYADNNVDLFEDEKLSIMLDKKLNFQDKVIISKEIKDENNNLLSYEISSINDEDFIAYVSPKKLKNDKTDWISIKYENVDYQHFDRTKYKKNKPEQVKGVYVSQTAAKNAMGLLDNLLNLAKNTEINTFVIDVKDDNDNLLFYSETAQKYLPEVNKNVAISNPKEFIDELKSQGIYLVARVVSFKSPKFATHYQEKSLHYKADGKIYSDRDGLKWSSPYDEELWEYIVGISKEAIDLGFDEIQFDYIRFPATTKKTDENLVFYNQNNRSKVECIQQFLKYAYDEISSKGAYVTADIFGWIATSVDDQNIGQHWEAMSNIVDYMAPMVYPSHYGINNFGILYPDKEPYRTVDASIKDAIKRNKNIYTPAKLRPWIQDFTASYLGSGKYIVYGPKEIQAQIKALEDNGIYEFMLWNASNKYTVGGLREN